MAAQVQTEEELGQERPISIPEVRALLEKEQAEREELTYEQKLALEHATTFSRIALDRIEPLVAELSQMPRLTAWHCRKIVDLAPTHPDDVRAVFAKDRFTLENEDIDRIINAVKASLE